MDAHICQSCGHLWSVHTMYSDTNHCRSPGCVCERSQLNAEKHNHIDLRARVESLESQLSARDAELAAEREAVRVLGEEVSAWHEWNDRDPHEPDKGIGKIEDARERTEKNPLARASVEKAGQNNEQ